MINMGKSNKKKSNAPQQNTNVEAVNTDEKIQESPLPEKKVDIGSRKLMKQMENQKREEETLMEARKEQELKKKAERKSKPNKTRAMTNTSSLKAKNTVSTMNTEKSKVDAKTAVKIETPENFTIPKPTKQPEESSLSTEKTKDYSLPKQMDFEKDLPENQSLPRSNSDRYSANTRSHEQTSFRESSSYRNEGRSQKQFDNKNLRLYNNQSNTSWSRNYQSEENNSGFIRKFNQHSNIDEGRNKSDSNRNEGYKRQKNYDYYNQSICDDGYRDKDFRDFKDALKKSTINSDSIQEITGDLFTADDDYALAHCVAEDMSMGAGIAVLFRQKYKQVPQLLNQHVKTGGVAILQHEKRYIYYLVTKERSYGKPTLYTLWSSLKNMKKHMEESEVKKLAVPLLGCGLDRLQWTDVKKMIAYIFLETDIEIVVYSLDDDPSEAPSKPTRIKAYVKHVIYPLVKIESGTALIYLGSADGYETNEIKSLTTKYSDLLNLYKRTHKQVGDIIQSELNKEILYGLILTQKYDDMMDYVQLDKTLRELKKKLKKDDFQYVGLQAFEDKRDKVCLDKIINVMQGVLLDQEIWVCYPEELKHLAPPLSTPY